MDVKILYLKVGQKPYSQKRLEEVGEYKVKMIYDVRSLAEAKRKFRKAIPNARIHGYETD